MSLSRSHADSYSVARATEFVGSATLVSTLATRSVCAATSVVSPLAFSVWPATCSLPPATSVVHQTPQVVCQTTRVVWQPTEVVCQTTCLARRSTRTCSTRLCQRSRLSSSVFHASSQSNRTPNHALQRTAPGCHGGCSPQSLPRSRRASPPPSLSLRSLGDIAHAFHRSPQRNQPTTKPKSNEQSE